MPAAEQLEQQHQQDLVRIRNFRLLDDDFMTMCFADNPKYVQLVLRILLDLPDLKVVDVKTQVFMANLLKRSVRLDILAVGQDGRIMNVEVQRADKGAGWKRARYNSSMIDAASLQKGAGCEELPETYVIFITEHDVVGRGLPLYRVHRYFETGERFEDGSHILYVNGAYRDESPVGKLMHDFSCKDPDQMNYDVLAERVRFFKESRKGVSMMCKVIEDMRNESYQEGRQEGLQEGRQEGRQEGLQEGAQRERNTIARHLLNAGKYSLEEISEISRLSPDEVRRLQTTSPS